MLWGAVGYPTLSQESNALQEDALTRPPVRRDISGSSPRAQGYRGELATSQFRLDRSGSKTERAVQERQWELGAERTRIEGELGTGSRSSGSSASPSLQIRVP
jgi:hypothetical protein